MPTAQHPHGWDYSEPTLAGDSGTDKRKKGAGKVKSDDTDWSSLSAVEASRKLKKLEKQMYEHARNLEFEQAAQMRDQLEQLRNSVFIPAETD